MSLSTITKKDDNTQHEISLTPPPLSEKHTPIDMFWNNEQQEDEKTNEKCSTPTTSHTTEDPSQDVQCQTPKKFEPVLGKERAIKILKAFGNQQKPIKEINPKTPNSCSKPKKEKKSLTPMEKAKETISEIEELKKIKDRMIPTYFGENVVIHHIKLTHPTNDATQDIEPIAKKSTVDSLEALKVYDNLDADKQSDEEMVSEKEVSLQDKLEIDVLTAIVREKKKKLPTAFKLKAKRAKEKRRKRDSLDSVKSDKKHKLRNKNGKKKKSRDSSLPRLSKNKSEKRSKRKNEPAHDNEVLASKVRRSESESYVHPIERFTKTLPVIMYCENIRSNRLPLTNGLSSKESTKTRSTSKTKLVKMKSKKSSKDRSSEKLREKDKRRSESKTKRIKSIKKRRRSSAKSELNLNPKLACSDIIANGPSLDMFAQCVVNEKSLKTKNFQSDWDDWDSIDDRSNLETLISLDTIPLQLNVPKQDRSTLFTNLGTIKTSDEFGQLTPIMTESDSAVTTPIISTSFPQIKDDFPEIDDQYCMKLNNVENDSNLNDSLDHDLSKYISNSDTTKTESKTKNIKIDEVKSTVQPIAQLYDEYEQFIMSCLPTADLNQNDNGDKVPTESSILDEMVTSNDGEEELEALKKSLELKLHEIEHNDSEDATAIKETEKPTQNIETILLKSAEIAGNESSDSSSSSSSSSSSDSSSSSSTSSPSRKKKSRNKKKLTNVKQCIDADIFNFKVGMEDDELSDDELISKVEQLKQQMSEKRKALANKRKLTTNDFEISENIIKSETSDALLTPDKRSAISLKIGSFKSCPLKGKPVTLDDDDFTEKLLLEVTSTPKTVAQAKETNKLLIERVIEPEVGFVSSSNSSSLASEIINTKVTRIGMLPSTSNVSNVYGNIHPTGKNLSLGNSITEIDANQSLPVDTSEMKNYLNSATLSHYDSSDSITSKTSTSVDSSLSNNSLTPVVQKTPPVKLQTSPPRSDKVDSSESTRDSKTRPASPYHRSRTKNVSNKRHYSPSPSRHRSPRSRRRSSYRSPIRKRNRGSPRRSPRKSPRRYSPRLDHKSLSPRSKRSLSPIRGRPRTPPLPDKHTNRKWEPPHVDYATSMTKSSRECDNNAPQPICRLESSSTSWSGEQNSAFAPYDYEQSISPKGSLDSRSFDQSYDFHESSGEYLPHIEYSAENTSKIPVLNSQENYYFQPHHVPPPNLPPQHIPPSSLPPQHIAPPSLPPQHIAPPSLPPQHIAPSSLPPQHIAPPNLPPQHIPRQHVAPQHTQLMVPSPLPPQPLPTQQRFPNLIEIRQSNITEIETTPFVLKGNVLEIVPNSESMVSKPRTDSAAIKFEDSKCDMNVQIKVELTQEEMELRELKKAEINLKRKQERDKRHLERFMRKEKLRLEIKHLMELSAPITEVKKATYNPNAIGGKSILRLNAPSSNKKSVLFADGVAPGDGTSTSGGEDVAPLLRDRNKRMTKRKLDSKKRRARRDTSIIKKEAVASVTEITPFIDPELENMPPPLPPDGNPPARLPQPKLKSTPKLIYFHYDPRSNAMYVSPYPTPVHIPDKPSDKAFSTITKNSMDSPLTSSTPDQIQRPKVCFIQPPGFEQRPQQEIGPILPAQPLPNSNQQPLPTLTNPISSVDVVPSALPPMNPFKQQSSSVIYQSRHLQSNSPLHHRSNVDRLSGHPVGQPPVQLQPAPMQMQRSAMDSQWENTNYQTNAPSIQPPQQQPRPPHWESDIYFPQSTAVRPHKNFNNLNNIPQHRPPQNLWDHQQRHPAQQIFQKTCHPPQSSFGNMPSHQGLNHQMFHQNQPINPQHQQQNNFAFNSNNHSLHYNSNHPNQQWNHQYRNNQ